MNANVNWIAHNKWKALKQEIRDKIDVIDKETKWQEKEPGWWLEMMDVRQCICDTDKKEYKCQRCNKVFEAVAYKSDNQAACPFCPGIGNRIKIKKVYITESYMFPVGKEPSGEIYEDEEGIYYKEEGS